MTLAFPSVKCSRGKFKKARRPAGTGGAGRRARAAMAARTGDDPTPVPGSSQLPCPLPPRSGQHRTIHRSTIQRSTIQCSAIHPYCFQHGTIREATADTAQFTAIIGEMLHEYRQRQESSRRTQRPIRRSSGPADGPPTTQAHAEYRHDPSRCRPGRRMPGRVAVHWRFPAARG